MGQRASPDAGRSQLNPVDLTVLPGREPDDLGVAAASNLLELTNRSDQL